MARQESTLKIVFDQEQALKALRAQIIDKDRTNALTNIAAIKSAIDGLKTTLDATTLPVDFDSLD